MKKIYAEIVAPFDFSRLYGPEKYRLDNMLLREVNYPAWVYQNETDRVTSTWDDRLHGFIERAKLNAMWKLVKSEAGGDAFFAGATEKSLLTFGKALGEAIKFGYPVTGIRVVRFTNLASGYPTLRFDLSGVETEAPRRPKRPKGRFVEGRDGEIYFLSQEEEDRAWGDYYDGGGYEY